MILDLMLDQLGIPRATYPRRLYSHNMISIIVVLYTSVQSNGTCPTQMFITGIPFTDEAVAEDSAAVEAIRYMENATNTVKDLNYGRLEKLQQEIVSLRLQLNEAFDIRNRLARGWLLAVRYMSSFSEQLHNVMALGFPPGHSLDKSTNASLLNIEEVAHNLKCRGYRLEIRTEKEGSGKKASLRHL